VPLGIAFVGLATTIHADRISRVPRETLLRMTPGTTDQVVSQTLEKSQNSAGRGDSLALWVGLAVALIALTTAMGQIERGANRIYGVQRDRPALRKYARAVTNAVTAGLFSPRRFRHRGGGRQARPGRRVGLRLVQHGTGRVAAAALPDRHPARARIVHAADHAGAAAPPTRLVVDLDRGRASHWCCGALLTGLLALYVQTSGSFGSTYGPLTGVMALLLWANLTSVAIFLGIAFGAQLEAVHASVPEPDPGDPEAPITR
jgi:hypothetical protein